MFRRKLKVDDPVRVDALANSPAHRRICRVIGILPGDVVKVQHVLSKSVMEVADKACELLPDKPSLIANIDCLVGRRVRIALKDGTRLHGMITGVMYQEVELLGERLKQVLSLELDGSQSTTYGWDCLKSVESI